MAIVFISPKTRQKQFLWWITSISFCIFALIAIIVFFPGFLPSKPKKQIVFAYPDVKINFDLLDSGQVKNLDVFPVMQTIFAYTATDSKGKNVNGSISAATQDDVTKILEGQGLKILTLDTAKTGRDEPFLSYYTIAPSNTKSTVKK